MRAPLGVALLTCAAVASLLVGCGGDEETHLETGSASATASAPTERPTSAPTATTTAAAESDGEAGFREFAKQIEAALRDGDGSFFANRAVEQDLVCAGDEQVGICAGVPAGTAFRGISRGIFQTDSFDLTSPDQYADDLVDWFVSADPELEDVYGDGTVALYAVAYKAAGGGAEEAYQAIITAIVTSDAESLRQARSLSFGFVDGRWRLTGEIAANLPQTAEAWLSDGCDYCYDRWEPWEG
jgi:hypothetical protein